MLKKKASIYEIPLLKTTKGRTKKKTTAQIIININFQKQNMKFKHWFYFIIVPILFISIISYVARTIIIPEQTATWFSFAMINFAAYLFFLVMPIEALFPYYLTLGFNSITLTATAIVTALFAQWIDYEIGIIFRKKIIGNAISKKNFTKYDKTIHKYGGGAIFLFNLTPLSSPILLLVAGIVRYDMKKAFIYSTLGLTIKYSSLAFLF